MNNIVANLFDVIKYYVGYPHQDRALKYLWNNTPEEVKKRFTALWRETQEKDYSIIINSVPTDRRHYATTAIPLLMQYCDKYKVYNPNHIAYIIATVSWECAFRPIREIRANPKTQPLLYSLQERYWHTGFYGRGYIQITWENNYRRLGHRLGLGDQLVLNPDKVLDPKISAEICVVGMAEGLFTGRKLSDYDLIGDPSYDFFNARRIVNGLDRASTIKSYAEYYVRFVREWQSRQPKSLDS